MKIGDYLNKSLKGKKTAEEKEPEDGETFSAVGRLAKHLGQKDSKKFREMLKDAIEELNE